MNLKYKNLFIPLLFLMISSFNSYSQNIVGPWKGELKIPTGTLTLVFHINYENERFTGKMDVIEQGAKGIPIHEIQLNKPFLTINLPNLGIKYVGNVLDDDHIEGTFEQNGLKLPLNLVKTLDIGIEKVKPQEPKPPYPYITQNITFENKKDGITLSGTFTRPTEGKKYPVIVLISGSGPQDRNQEILGHKPFLLIADQFSRNGIAVLRFDDRGTGKSTGYFKEATTYDFAEDVQSAVEYLSTREDIDTNKIGLLGHSEGAIVASIVGDKNDNINRIILMGGPAVRGNEVMLYQKKIIEEKSSIPQSVVDKNQKIFSEAYQIILRNEQPLYDKLSEYFKHQYNHQISDKQIHALAASLSSKWITEFIKLDPAVYLKNVNCPVLALFGEKDLQVAPVQNKIAMENALSHNPNAKIVEIEGVNHLFQTCSTGLPTEYGQLEETLSPVVINEMVNWLKLEN